MDNFIELKNVTFKYDGDDPADNVVLENFSLDIKKGSFTVILGHNGSGKSTLAKLLNGLNKPDSGTVLVDGIDTLDEKKEFDVRRRVGMVFQNPDNQIVCSIVEEDVAFGPENLGIPPKEIRARVDAALEAVGMTEFKNAAPHRLSGGQKQRVALAGILAMEPMCIVLDEPTAMLDPIGRKEVISAITRLNKEKGITVVLITHFMEEAENADRIIVMNKGNIVGDGIPSEVYSNAEVIKSAGLSLPQTTELLMKLKSKGVNVTTSAISPLDAAREIFNSLKGAELK